MPARFRLKNFQAYEDVEVEVDGLTAVAGPNNGGKSAIARAIRAAFQNTPSAHLVRRGAPLMEVDVDLGDTRFLWGRKAGTGGRPLYRVDGTTLYPGREVPPQVREAGVRAVEVGGEAVWPQFARQGEAAFLVDRSGAYLAEAVCDPGRAELLAQAARLLESDRRGVRGRLATAQEVLRDARGWLAYLGPAEQSAQEAVRIPSRLAQVEARLAEVERLGAMRARLADLVGRERHLSVVRTLRVPSADRLRGLLARAGQMRTVRDHLVVVLQRQEAFRVVTTQHLPDGERLRVLLARRAEVARVRDRIARALRHEVVREAIASLTLPEAQGVRARLDRLRTLRSARERVRVAQERLRVALHDVEESRAALVLAERCRDEMVTDAGACPFCGSTAPNERRTETPSHEPATRHHAADGGSLR